MIYGAHHRSLQGRFLLCKYLDYNLADLCESFAVQRIVVNYCLSKDSCKLSQISNYNDFSFDM